MPGSQKSASNEHRKQGLLARIEFPKEEMGLEHAKRMQHFGLATIQVLSITKVYWADVYRIL